MPNEMKRGSTKAKELTLESRDKHPYHCTSCGKCFMRQKENFNKSPSPYYAGNNGYLHICQSCVEKAFNYYRDEVFDGDQDKAMELLCATINTVFDETAWANAKKHPQGSRGKVSVYFSKLNLAQTRGASYADTILTRKANKTENAPSIDAAAKNPEIGTSIDTIRRFGLGFKDEDYEALQYEYDDWVSRYGVPEDKRQDELYKNICYLKLHYLHAVQKGDAGVSSLAKEYKSSIAAATTELEDRKQEKEDAVKLDPLGMWVADIERYTPSEYFKDKSLFRDDDGLGSYAQRFILRPLKNLLTGSKELDKEFSLSDKEG